MQRQVRSLNILLVTMLLLLLNTQGAAAHAVVVRAEPADGAVLAGSPGQMTVWLSEAVVPRFSTVQLLDSQNSSISGVSVETDPNDHTVLHIALPDLPDDTYTLFWKVLSDVDGHFNQGFITLAIGQEAAATPTAANTELATPLETILRWANYLLLTGLIGAMAMLYLVLPGAQTQADRAAAAAQQQLRCRVWQWAAACAAAAFLVGLALLAWQIHQAQALMGDTKTWPAQIWLVLGGSQWGLLWLVRQGLLLCLSGALWYWSRLPKEPTATWPWLLLYGRVIDLTIIQALTGHSGGSRQDWLLTLSNATLHLLAAGVWVGGLLTVALILWARRNQPIVANPSWQPIQWRAFSLAAVVSVGLLFATGFYSTGQQVASVDALLTSLYGQVLLGKVLLVLLAGICGLGNALMVHPPLVAWLGRRLGRPVGWQPWHVARFPRLIAIEVFCGMVILGAAGLLTASAPPLDIAYTIAPDEITPVVGQRVDDLIVTLEAKPNRLGKNLFNIRLVSAVPEASPLARVSLEFRYNGEEREPVTAVAEEVETNLYQVTGNYLNQVGPWQIDVVMRRYDMTNVIAHFRWVAPPAGELQPVLLSKAPWHNLLTNLAFILLALLVVGIVFTVTYREWYRHRLSTQPMMPIAQVQSESGD